VAAFTEKERLCLKPGWLQEGWYSFHKAVMQNLPQLRQSHNHWYCLMPPTVTFNISPSNAFMAAEIQ
jgi:hypothetical protein